MQAIVGTGHDICSRIQLQRPNLKLLSSPTGTVTETVKSDFPDLAFLTSFKSGKHIKDVNSLLLSFRRDQSNYKEPNLV